MKILLVEDERLISLVMSRMISAMGHTVVACLPSAETALDFIEGNRPDFVLLDIHLEGKMDGIQAAAIIHEKWRIPLAFASAYIDADTRERAAASEPIALLGKPISKEDLAELFGDVGAA